MTNTCLNKQNSLKFPKGNTLLGRCSEIKTITFFNNKGGVGKTTLAVNVASYIALRHKKRVLFLDADPQANSTQMVVNEETWPDFYEDDATRGTIMSILSLIHEGDSNIDPTIKVFPSTESKFGFDLIPGHPRLSMIEDLLSQSWNDCNGGDLGGFRRTNWLKQLTTHYSAYNYDILIIDVGPSLGALNRSILLNSDFMITPMGSDIFSMIGVSNIAHWIKGWVASYEAAVKVLERTHSEETRNKYLLTYDTSQIIRIAGFSVQQYVKRSFKSGERAVSSYDRIIQKIPEKIEENLSYLFPEGLTVTDLNLGDVPFLYSLVPLAQSANAPMFNLTTADGVVGGQQVSVKKYAAMLETISIKILKNIGEPYEDSVA